MERLARNRLNKRREANQGFKVDRYQSDLYVMLKQLLRFYKLNNFYHHSLMNRQCYNNLFQIMQHENFQNLKRVVFTQ